MSHRTKPVRHGTTGGYTHGKCRCGPCSEAMRSYQAAYREKNRERILEVHRAYYAANREQRKADVQARRDADLEGHLARRRAAYLANRDAELAKVLAWQRDHPAERRETRRRRRLALADADIRVVTVRDWRRLCERYDHRCAYCGARAAALTQDHIIPIARGGRHSIGNLLPACATCNSSKNSRLLIEWSRTRNKESVA